MECGRKGEIRVVGLSWDEFVQRKVQCILSTVVNIGLSIGHCLNLVQRQQRVFGKERPFFPLREAHQLEQT
jgi:hypothetical protein